MERYHDPVLLKESIDGLQIKPNGIYVDITFGGGGHSREILRRLKKGRLIGFDQDADAEKNVEQDKRFTFLRQNFRFLQNNLRYLGIDEVDGIIGDLGISSFQINESGRGFAFRLGGKLDMRMNQQATVDAIKIINQYSIDKLRDIFREYGEIKNVGKLASSIIASRDKKLIENIEEFIDIIGDCIPRNKENQYLAKVFQALRIEVNQEIKYLKEFLSQTEKVLKKGGRLSIISYHSLEDRLVKNYIKSGNFYGKIEKDIYGNFEAPFKAVNNKVIVPDEEEIKTNNRARSAKLRIAEKM